MNSVRFACCGQEGSENKHASVKIAFAYLQVGVNSRVAGRLAGCGDRSRPCTGGQNEPLTAATFRYKLLRMKARLAIFMLLVGEVA